ncbi:MAG: branched-chain amino acid ABC transporter substrate-binding protein [Rhizobiales bacterium PAR1]|nr:MAG: branched-chain amino acid ABC transporter substrate-binding protein [Rhizobiales bacterium PAR1]
MGLTAALLGLAPAAALAQVNVGITVSQTGPAAALGIPQKNSVAQLPKELAGQKIEYIVLDDATDPTKAVANARKMITENKIDILIGSSATPATLALVDVAAETKTPFCGMVPTGGVVRPMDEKRKWAFKAPQDDALLADALADHMVANGVKSVGFIGYTDGYGQGWLDEVQKIFPAKGIKITAVERFQRTDTSVTAQGLKIVSTNPDAVLIVASGTVAVMPQKTLREQGFTKTVYQTAGISTMEFVRVGGKDVEGTIFPAGPVIAADLLPDSHPSKKVSLAYIKEYEAINKSPYAGFGAHLYDCGLFMLSGVGAALTKGKPGTPEFRAALRDGIENQKEVAATHGVYSFSPTDHAGLDKRARVLIKVVNGKWTLLP